MDQTNISNHFHHSSSIKACSRSHVSSLLLKLSLFMQLPAASSFHPSRSEFHSPITRLHSHHNLNTFHTRITADTKYFANQIVYLRSLCARRRIPSLLHSSTDTIHSSPLGKEQAVINSPLGLTLEELSNELDGSGRANIVWDCLRMGIDPNLYFSNAALSNQSNNNLLNSYELMEQNMISNDYNVISSGGNSLSQLRRDVSDVSIAEAWLSAISASNLDHNTFSADCLFTTSDSESNFSHEREMGLTAWKKLQNKMQKYNHSNNEMSTISEVELQDQENIAIDEKTAHGSENKKNIRYQKQEKIFTIENCVASLSHMRISPDGTVKFLLKLVHDGLEVESVIIPWTDKGFSTLCVSSQVGCRQGCTFCATGRMGKLRSLTSDEIIVQIYYASKICRIIKQIVQIKNEHSMGKNIVPPPVDNVVFMGMGEPADNAEAVVHVVKTLVDRRMFGLAQSKVTISTVAPDPMAFIELGKAPAALAWSVHAVDDILRKTLIPTTKHSMEELRLGLVKALLSRSRKLRRTMLEVALIDGVNDSSEDANNLALFARSIMIDVPGAKVVVNLIPFNDIGHPYYRTPSKEQVLKFQKEVIESANVEGSGATVLCYIRTTRGDEESAACGQLATKKKTK